MLLSFTGQDVGSAKSCCLAVLESISVDVSAKHLHSNWTCKTYILVLWSHKATYRFDYPCAWVVRQSWVMKSCGLYKFPRRDFH